MRIKRSFGEVCFDIVNVTLLSLACLAVMIPILHVLAASLSSTYALTHSEVTIWPVDFNLDNYIIVFQNETFWRSFGVTLIVVSVGTALNMTLTVLTSYPLSKMYLRGRQAILLFIIFTMIFQAPLIPTYLLVRFLGMLDTLWALIIPSALSAFNMMLCITFFRGLPEELFEAARVDGMSEYRIVWKIVVPLSMPIMVTLFLFYAVAHWNNYFSALIYITDARLRPLQLYLYQLLAQFNTAENYNAINELLAWDVSPQGLQMATIIVATLPILMIYPFLQKHFIKGALLGSLKE